MDQKKNYLETNSIIKKETSCQPFELIRDDRILPFPTIGKDILLYVLTICLLYIVLLEVFQGIRSRAQRHMPRAINTETSAVVLKTSRLR